MNRAQRERCQLTSKGRQFTCRELWPDNGPYAWCELCQERAEQELRRLVKQLGTLKTKLTRETK
jgi:hypothetical protein